MTIGDRDGGPDGAGDAESQAIVPVGETGVTVAETEAGELAEQGPDRKFQTVLATSTLLTGACRFVPIPLLDDYLEVKVRHAMIHTLLRFEQRTMSASRLAAVYGGTEGCLEGCAVSLIKLPITLTVKLIMKIFKSVLIVLLIREAAVHMGETLLLGHTIGRHMERGGFAEGSQENLEALNAEAAQVRDAFDKAFAGTDMRVLRSLLETALRSVKGLPRIGARAVRAMFGRRDKTAESPGTIPESAKPVIDDGVQAVESALEREEIVGFLKDFDKRFDEALEFEKNPAAYLSYSDSSDKLPPAKGGDK